MGWTNHPMLVENDIRVLPRDLFEVVLVQLPLVLYLFVQATLLVLAQLIEGVLEVMSLFAPRVASCHFELTTVDMEVHRRGLAGEVGCLLESLGLVWRTHWLEVLASFAVADLYHLLRDQSVRGALIDHFVRVSRVSGVLLAS